MVRDGIALESRVAEALSGLRSRMSRLHPAPTVLETVFGGRASLAPRESPWAAVEAHARRASEARSALAAARARALPGDAAAAREAVLSLRERLAAAEAERAARSPAYDADPLYAYLASRMGRGGPVTGALDRWLARASGFEAERGKREILEALPGYLAARLAEAERESAALEAARALPAGPGVPEAEAGWAEARAALDGAERTLATEAARAGDAGRAPAAEAARLRALVLEVEGLAADWRASGVMGSRLPAEAELARLDAVLSGA